MNAYVYFFSLFQSRTWITVVIALTVILSVIVTVLAALKVLCRHRYSYNENIILGLYFTYMKDINFGAVLKITQPLECSLSVAIC